MLNLNEERPAQQNTGGPRQFYTGNGFFGGFLRKDGFGLHGKGIFHIDAEQNKIDLSGETPLPLIISAPLGFIPVIGQAIRTLYRPSADFSFRTGDVAELVRSGRKIQFKAPKNTGGRLKRVEFTAETEAEAQEIESAVKRLNPAVTSGRLVTTLTFGRQWLKIALGVAAAAVVLFLVVYVGAAVSRFAGASYEAGVSLQRFNPGSNLNRQAVTLFSQGLDYPEAGKGIFQRGGHVLLDVTFAPDGSFSDAKVVEMKNDSYGLINYTKNPALIEAAMNSARQNKFAAGNGEVKIQLRYKFSSRFDAALPYSLEKYF